MNFIFKPPPPPATGFTKTPRMVNTNLGLACYRSGTLEQLRAKLLSAQVPSAASWAQHRSGIAQATCARALDLCCCAAACLTPMRQASSRSNRELAAVPRSARLCAIGLRQTLRRCSFEVGRSDSDTRRAHRDLAAHRALSSAAATSLGRI